MVYMLWRKWCENKKIIHFGYNETLRDNFRVSIIGGYHYTENAKAELEVIFGSPKEDSYIVNLLAGLRCTYNRSCSIFWVWYGCWYK